jgi:DNA-binding NarL/FixJ family response regulator
MTLTPRQRIIYRLVRRGMTSRQIADQLGISSRTVEVHRSNIARNLAGQRASNRHPPDSSIQLRLRKLSKELASLVSELGDLRAPR